MTALWELNTHIILGYSTDELKWQTHIPFDKNHHVDKTLPHQKSQSLQHIHHASNQNYNGRQKKRAKDERKSTEKVGRVEKLSVKEEGKVALPVSKWEVFKARWATYEVSLYRLLYHLVLVCAPPAITFRSSESLVLWG